MNSQKFNACIEACNACAVACNHCASSCLRKEDVKMMTRSIALDIDCAQVCMLAAAAMARSSEHADAICALCADICEACGAEYSKHVGHGMEYCQACAKACLACAKECRQMAILA